MTLAEFAPRWPYTIVRHSSGAMVTPDADTPDRWRLWLLSDYVVSSVTGGSVWLIRRNA
jgi:hypothetical protein